MRTVVLSARDAISSTLARALISARGIAPHYYASKAAVVGLLTISFRFVPRLP